MATLKYYKVDGDGKIKRLRRECPAPECGAGIFMAWHSDRQYCGKCREYSLSRYLGGSEEEGSRKDERRGLSGRLEKLHRQMRLVLNYYEP